VTLAVYLLLGLLAAGVLAELIRHRAVRWALRTVHRRRLRVHRFKLARRPQIRAELLGNAEVLNAASSYAREHAISESDALACVRSYIDEIVPFFNILAYHSIGYAVSKALLNFFYRVSAEYVSAEAAAELPRDSIVI
jgi:glycerol-3-phosphate O-acyltransferase